MNAPVDAGLAAALATLGLRPDADARSVRRAYAQQVKQIDQATQLHAFQELREAYELALRGIARQEAQTSDAAPTPEVEPSQPSSNTASAGFAPPDSAELARAVFLGFAVRADADFKDEAEATSALQDALADNRLLNLEARTLFELQVAHRIMNGWQPGHEFLFGPACAAFHWESDRGHLRVFGQLGAALDAAINEKLIFFDQPIGNLDRLDRVIKRLRRDELPSSTLLREDLHFVQLLVQRYPNWLRLVTSQSNINTWFSKLPPEEPAAPVLSTSPAEPLTTLDRGWKPKPALTPWLIGLFVVFMLAKLLAGGSTPGYRPPPGLGRPQSTLPNGPPTNPWPESALDPSKGSQFGSGATVPAPLYRDLPPPSQAPSPQPQAAGAQFAFLGNVTFNRTSDQITVDEVDKGSARGRSTLQPGDRVEGCPTIDKRVPFAFALESSACGTVKSVDGKTGIVTYVFRVLRRGQSTTAALVMPPPQEQARTAANAAAVEEALKAAITLPRPPGAEPEAVFYLGHVSFALVRGQVLVHGVGPRTRRSFGTLQVGDQLLRCMSGDYQVPLTQPAEAQHCIATNGINQEPGVTPYMFRVWRNGQSISASLTTRDAEAATP